MPITCTTCASDEEQERGSQPAKVRGERRRRDQRKEDNYFARRWVQCDECQDWVLFENSGVTGEWLNVDWENINLICKACKIEAKQNEMEKAFQNVKDGWSEKCDEVEAKYWRYVTKWEQDLQEVEERLKQYVKGLEEKMLNIEGKLGRCIKEQESLRVKMAASVQHPASQDPVSQDPASQDPVLQEPGLQQSSMGSNSQNGTQAEGGYLQHVVDNNQNSSVLDEAAGKSQCAIGAEENDSNVVTRPRSYAAVANPLGRLEAAAAGENVLAMGPSTTGGVSEPRQKAGSEYWIVVGDSNVARLWDVARDHLVGRQHSRFVAVAGGRLGDVAVSIRDLVKEAPAEAVKVILHAGMNDIGRYSRGGLLRALEVCMAEATRDKKKVDLWVCTIPERVGDARSRWTGRATNWVSET